MAKHFVCADALFNATNIRQVATANHATNQEHVKAMNSGGAAVVMVSGKSSGEITQIVSGDLAALIALNSNAFCSAGLSLLASTITVPFKIRSAGALFASGSNNVHLTGANALIVPTSFEASQDGDFALANVDIHWLSSDGVAKGCDDASGVAVATQAFNAIHTLGPCYINGTLIAGVQSAKINPGIEVVKPPLGSGSNFPVFASIKMVTPTIQLTVNDFDAVLGTIGDFTAMTSANIYFKKRNDSGVFVAGATAEHLRFTFAAGLADTENISVNGNEDGSSTITLHGKTLTASAAVALP
jgi:hypothetical protein